VSQQRIAIQWSALTQVSEKSGSYTKAVDLSTAKDMVSLETEKPFVVYLTSSDEDDKSSQDVVENTTFKDERIAITAKFFGMYKGTGELITKEHPYAPWLGGRKLPRIVVFNSSGDQIGKLEGRVSPSKLVALMAKAATKSGFKSLDSKIKEYQKFLTEIDKIETKKQALAVKEKNAETKARKEEIDKEKKELAEQEEILRKQEEEILTQ